MNESTDILVDIMSEQTARAAAKERIGFEEAFTLHHRTVFRAARSVVHDAALAEDVAQETFLRLYKHQDSITDDEMLRPWLIRVAINLAKNTIRGNVRANTRDENYVKETLETTISSVEIDYEEYAGVNEIYKALNKIKEPLRSCLILKQQGLSYKEIAGSLDLNEGSIGTFVARARQEFSRLYGKIGKETI
ncbi:MAG TPA: sigma-70 family RNA polymerase sigma factor [Pyrinomonadaceae bacterium]|nr:sigma-70 family RNA polymerase sigma factor [Pyrinomonadaceae bacterium]